MTTSWNAPGSRWRRFDFHVHTPASVKDYKNPEITPAAWLQSCMAAQLDAVVVTDHNSGDWIDCLKAAHAELVAQSSQPEWFRPLVIFPGFEISLGQVHLLAVFDPSHATKNISAILGQCGITNGHGDPDTLATTSFVETIEIIKRENGIPLPAHIDGDKGLLSEAASINPDLKRSLEAVYAAEFCDLNAFADANPELEKALNRLARVGGSDAHAPAAIGRHGSWVKMSRPTIEGLRLALLDHEFCIDNGTENPNREPDVFVQSLSITGMRHCGRKRGLPFELPFLSGFNAIIGGRGTGKSTALDAIRIAARRHEELSDFPSLSKDLNQFMDYASRKGVMENDSEILLGIQRRGDKYRLRWRKDSTGTVLERWERDDWVATDPGDLRERFPLNIYSQKQLYELAENPGGLLAIIDRAPQVDRGEWEQRWKDAVSRFAELRLRQRKIAEDLRQETELQTKLADVSRDLRQYEEKGHGAILKRYQKRTTQLRAFPLADDFGGLGDRLLKLHEEAQLDSFPFHLFDEDDPARLEVSLIHGKAANDLAVVQTQLRALAVEVDRIAKERTSALQVSNWHGEVRTAGESYAALVREYETTKGQFDPSLYGQWVQEKSRLETALAKLATLQREKQSLAEGLKTVLTELLALRRELSARRQLFIETVIGASRYVKMELIPFGNVSNLEAEYRDLMALDESNFKSSILDEEGGLLGSLFRWREDGVEPANLAELIEEIKRKTARLAAGAENATSGIAKPFITRLQKGYETQPANLDRLWCWWPEDLLRIKHSKGEARGKFEELERGSAGQKAAAILAFLLSHGNEPLIIDQPEDDLDNALIYDLVVRQIKENKLRRQLIVVTHNPNIVVNGDAELVHVLHVKSGQIQPDVSGGMEEQAVRDRICEVMEGGREAFEMRYKRITA